MAKTVYPPNVQAMLDNIKRAKKAALENAALEKSRPANPFELITNYTVNQVQQQITLELASKSDMGACKESEKFLREFFIDDDYNLISAEINERNKPKFKTTDYFFIWRQQ